MNRTKLPIIFYIILAVLIILFVSCDDDICWLCGGGGKCSHCNGKGYTYVDSNVCTVCKGTGICLNCQGTGRIKPNKTVIQQLPLQTRQGSGRAKKIGESSYRAVCLLKHREFLFTNLADVSRQSRIFYFFNVSTDIF
jgi:hypothetical protein